MNRKTIIQDYLRGDVPTVHRKIAIALLMSEQQSDSGVETLIRLWTNLVNALLEQLGFMGGIVNAPLKLRRLVGGKMIRALKGAIGLRGKPGEQKAKGVVLIVVAILGALSLAWDIFTFGKAFYNWMSDVYKAISNGALAAFLKEYNSVRNTRELSLVIDKLATTPEGKRIIEVTLPDGSAGKVVLQGTELSQNEPLTDESYILPEETLQMEQSSQSQGNTDMEFESEDMTLEQLEASLPSSRSQDVLSNERGVVTTGAKATARLYRLIKTKGAPYVISKLSSLGGKVKLSAAGKTAIGWIGKIQLSFAEFVAKYPKTYWILRTIMEALLINQLLNAFFGPEFDEDENDDAIDDGAYEAVVEGLAKGARAINYILAAFDLDKDGKDGTFTGEVTDRQHAILTGSRDVDVSRASIGKVRTYRLVEVGVDGVTTPVYEDVTVDVRKGSSYVTVAKKLAGAMNLNSFQTGRLIERVQTGAVALLGGGSLISVARILEVEFQIPLNTAIRAYQSIDLAEEELLRVARVTSGVSPFIF
jgi:hypothetical protein